jgi:hypothetical protein
MAAELMLIRCCLARYFKRKPTLIKEKVKRVLLKYYEILSKQREPYRYIHLLTHPRSGSTLLSHILISHPDITGFGESKLVYTRPEDLKRLPILLALQLRKFPFLGGERYAFDKLVHNQLMAVENVGNIYHRNDCIIFLLREPISTLNSMSRLDWVVKKENPKAYVVKWYIERIKVMQTYCGQLKKSPSKQMAVLTFDQIIDDTKKVFEMLEAFLKLKHPLSEEYKIFRTTGRWGTGDASSFIKSGKIIRHREQKKPLLVNFDDQLDRINKVYQDCYRELTAHCLSIE